MPEIRTEDKVDEIFDYDTDVSRHGTRRIGTLKNASLQELRRQFGEPNKFGPKTTYDWSIRFPDGTIATIYDYNGKNRFVDSNENVEWSIGGHTEKAVEYLEWLGFETEIYNSEPAPV
jgi:hypothetical protein